MALSTSVGLKTSGKDLKALLEKTGYNMKKLDAGGVEKLDILKLIASQIMYQLESRATSHLTLSTLISFLTVENQAPSESNPRLAVVSLQALCCRERQRLGKHVAPEEVEVFEDSLALIPDSEILQLFGSDSGQSGGDDLFDAEGRRRDLLDEPVSKRLKVGDVKGDDLFDADGRRRDLIEPSGKHLENRASGAGLGKVVSKRLKVGDVKGDDLFDADGRRRDLIEPSGKHLENRAPGVGNKREAQQMLEDAAPEKVAQEDLILARIDPNAIQQHLPVLGLEDRKDDLAEIRGIGHWIQRRLNRIKITNFHQLARMTEAIAADVAKAIRFFPGRIHTDQWVYQAERLADGRAWIVNPPITPSGSSSIITVNGEKYERDLIDIARYYGKDEALLGAEHAECLWFSAMDGRVVTALERVTLRHILGNFKFAENGRAFLTGRLDA